MPRAHAERAHNEQHAPSLIALVGCRARHDRRCCSGAPVNRPWPMRNRAGEAAVFLAENCHRHSSFVTTSGRRFPGPTARSLLRIRESISLRELPPGCGGEPPARSR